MKTIRIGTAIALGFAAQWSSADIRSYLRFNDDTISFSNRATFSDARFDGTIAVNTFSDNAGDSLNGVLWDFPTGTRFDSWLGFGNLQVNNVVQHPDGSVTGDLLAGSTGNGYHVVKYGFDNPQTSSTFTRDNSGDKWTLKFTTGRFGGLDDHKPAYYQLKLPGDWSQTGTGTNQHARTLNPLWTIDNDFVFDGTSTVFNAHIPEFVNDGAHDIDLQLSLFGASVEYVVAPTSFNFALGILQSGTNSSLALDDGDVMKACKGFVPNLSSPIVRLDVDFTSPVDTLSAVKLVYKTRMTTGGAFVTRGFVADRTGGAFTYGAANQAVPDSTINLTWNTYAGFSPQPGLDVASDRSMRARLEIKQTGFSAVSVPCTEFEYVNLHLNP